MKIELREHPGKRHVKFGRSYVFTCPKCGKDTVAPVDRPAGRAVRCECGERCEPKLVSALPDQHGIYIEGKCVGYCTRERDPEIWFVERLDPTLIEEVDKVIRAKYGGDTLVHEKPEWPEEKITQPEDVDVIDDDEEENL